MKCPTDDDLRDALIGRISEDETESILAHVELCEPCSKAVVRLESESITTPLDEVGSSLRGPFPITTIAAECEKMIASSSQLIDGQNVGRDDFLSGIDSIRDYKLRDLLGEGGMGRVYRATHMHLKRDVAFKVLSPQRFGNPLAINQFRKEMEAVGKLDHPNLVRALDAGDHDGILYLVMELVQGIDLSQLMYFEQRLSVSAACRMAHDVAKGLDYAHQKGTVHRDVKPSNLILTTAGRVRILDLGLAIISSDHDAAVFAGSIPFMAPEQFSDHPSIDNSVDVYSLGCTLFLMLSGRTPVQFDSFHSHTQTHPLLTNGSAIDFGLLPKLPKGVEQILRSALDINPNNRPTCRQVADELRNHGSSASLKILVNKWSTSSSNDPISDDDDHLLSSRGTAASDRHRIVAVAAAFVAILGLFALAVFQVPKPTWFGASERTRPERNLVATDNIDFNNFLVVSVELAEQTESDIVRVLSYPGREIVVARGTGETAIEFRAWDPLRLRLSDDTSFDTYQRLAGQLLEFNERPVGPSFDPIELPPGIRYAIVRAKDGSGNELIDYHGGRHFRIFRLSSGKCVVSEFNVDSSTTSAAIESNFDSLEQVLQSSAVFSSDNERILTLTADGPS